MADIDSIISGVGGNTRANFSGLSEIVPSYWAGLDQAFKQRQRDQFKDGVPTDDAGNVDYGAVQRTLLQNGSPETAAKFGSLTLGQQQLSAARDDANFYAGGGNNPSVPPSTSRASGTPVAPPISPAAPSAPSSSPRGDQPGSIVGMISSLGVPDELAGPIIQQVSALAKIDPNKAVPADLAPRVQQIARAVVDRARVGSARQPQNPPASEEQEAPIDPFAGAKSRGLIPQGVDPQRYIAGLKIRAAASPSESSRALAKSQLEAIEKATEPTNEMKNAASVGLSPRKYQKEIEDRANEKDILDKSVLPILGKSQEGATAARSEIQALHRAREQLDMPGGIFSGSTADIRLRVAKIAEFIGVPNADKIANTESFASAIGERVLALVKGLGAGAGISNADREFAAAMGGGNIKLDEKSIRRILDIGERAARAKIEQHNVLVGKTGNVNDVLGRYSSVYEVEQPPEYKKQEAAKADGFTKGQVAVNPKTGERLMFDGNKWAPMI